MPTCRETRPEARTQRPETVGHGLRYKTEGQAGSPGHNENKPTDPVIQGSINGGRVHRRVAGGEPCSEHRNDREHLRQGNKEIETTDNILEQPDTRGTTMLNGGHFKTFPSLLLLTSVVVALIICLSLLPKTAAGQDNDAPNKPRNLSGTAAHDRVTLSWDDPANDSITGYQILRRDTGIHDPCVQLHRFGINHFT